MISRDLQVRPTESYAMPGESQMTKSRKRKWRRRLIGLAAIVIGVTIVLTALLFSRFHFSHQAFPTLARIQWNHHDAAGYRGERPQIVGHRGSGRVATRPGLTIGNTANAIRQGINAGVDWVEIDIRVSRDGHLLVYHDETIDSKTTGSGRVSDLTLLQLQEVEVLVHPPERIPSLDEVFATFHTGRQKWILDIKVKGVHQQVLAWLDGKVSTGELTTEQVLIFGTPDVLQDYTSAEYALGYIATWGNNGNKLRVLFAPSQLVDRCRALGCRYLVIPVIFANRSIIDTADRHGIAVWAYGSDDRRDLEHLAGRGISGFIVDHPEPAVEWFKIGAPDTLP